MMNQRGRAWLVVLFALSACGDQARGPTCAAALSHQRHACGHAVEGPHALLDGRHVAAVLASETHTHYRILLGDDAAGSYAGRVQFQAPRPGCWGFFVSGVQRLQAADECSVPRDFAATTAVSACAALERVFTLSMADRERLVLAISARQPEATLLIERVGTLPSDAGLTPPGCPAEPATRDADARAGDAPTDATSVASTSDSAADTTATLCRTSGPCTRDEECCDHCHDGDHCH